MKLKRHPLRRLSDLLHNIAMLPFMPMLIARPLANLSSKYYYVAK